MVTLRLLARFESAGAYLVAHEAEVAAGGLLVRGATLPPGTALGDCTLVVSVAGEADEIEVPARLAGAWPGQGVMVLLSGPEALEALEALAARLRGQGAGPGSESRAGIGLVSGSETGNDTGGDTGTSAEVDTGAGTEASAADTTPAVASGSEPRRTGPRELLTLPDKMRLAMTGDREARFSLLRDPIKQLHPLVLKNPRIGLDEVQWAAKLTTLNPDALKLIADHPEWGHAPAIAAALVRNPKTPIPSALKLIGRLPAGEVRALAKSQCRPQIVQAAKRQVIK